MVQTKITFFDIPSRLTSGPTSPNTWKVRLVLNFKGLDYNTRWVGTVDIESVCKSLRIPPTGIKPSGEPLYTLPALIDYTHSSEHPVIISDSIPIIHYLEQTYPSPHKLFPSGSESFHALFEHFLNTNIISHFPSLWFMAFYDSKTPGDQAHFRDRMEKTFGKRLEDVELQGSERENAWKELERAFNTMAGFFANSREGDFIAGRHVSYPDFLLCGYMICFKYISPSGRGGLWERITSWDHGRWLRYFQAFQGWMSVDNYVKNRL